MLCCADSSRTHLRRIGSWSPHSRVSSPGGAGLAEEVARADVTMLAEYKQFIFEVGSGIGELRLLPEENVPCVRAKLLRAARHLCVALRVWEESERVLFFV